MGRRQRKSRDRRSGRTTDRRQSSSAPKPSQQANRMRWLLCVGLVIGAVAIVGLWWIPLFSRPAGEASDRGMPTRGAINNAEPSLVDRASLPSMLPSSWSTVDDPGRDGWQSEVLAEQAGKQLKILQELLVSRAEIRASDVRDLVADRFVCPTPLPALKVVYEGALFRIERGTKKNRAVDKAESNERGPAVMTRELSKLTASFLAGQKRRVKIKVIGVQPEGDTFTTRQLLSISGKADSGLLERHVKFSSRWTTGGADEPPKLVQLDFEDFEQSHSLQETQPLFADCTEAVLGGNDCYREQFLYGYNHWLERTQDRQYFHVLGTPGVTLGDVNNDGLEDMYVCQEAGLPNRLFIQQADGTFRDVSREAGVDWLESSRTALLVDLDNDGDQDLVVGVRGGVVLAAGDGKGRFTIREVLDTSDDVMALAAADIDLDGRLDLFVGAYMANALSAGAQAGAATGGSTAAFVYHDANDGGANHLFLNRIETPEHWRFDDVTSAAGLDVNNRRWTLSAAWEDYDNDGDQDLYVANDYGRDNLYRNDGNADGSRTVQFTDISVAARVEDAASGMSVTWGDYDRDGWPDVYVSNMFSAAGNRIAFQSQFMAAGTPGVKDRIQRFARGNTLLRNRGDGKFDDQSRAAAVEMGRWAWGSRFVDINNDGWEDLVVANGYITTDDTGDL